MIDIEKYNKYKNQERIHQNLRQINNKIKNLKKPKR